MTKEEKIKEVMELVNLVKSSAWSCGELMEQPGVTEFNKHVEAIFKAEEAIESKLRELIQ